MMRRYIIAVSIGVIVGFAVLWSASMWAPHDWKIPAISQQVSHQIATGEASRLRFEARWLRFFHVMLDHGFWFFAIPISLSCAITAIFARLDKIGHDYADYWLISKVLQIMLYSTCLMAVAGACSGTPLSLAGKSFGKCIPISFFNSIYNLVLIWLSPITIFAAVPVGVLVWFFGKRTASGSSRSCETTDQKTLSEVATSADPPARSP